MYECLYIFRSYTYIHSYILEGQNEEYYNLGGQWSNKKYASCKFCLISRPHLSFLTKLRMSWACIKNITSTCSLANYQVLNSISKYLIQRPSHYRIMSIEKRHTGKCKWVKKMTESTCKACQSSNVQYSLFSQVCSSCHCSNLALFISEEEK